MTSKAEDSAPPPTVIADDALDQVAGGTLNRTTTPLSPLKPAPKPPRDEWITYEEMDGH